MNIHLNQIISKYKAAKKANTLAFGNAQEVVAELHSLTLSEKEEAIDFYREIGQDLLELNISIANYDAKEFEALIKDKKRRNKIKRTGRESKDKSTLTDHDKFTRFSNCLINVIPNLRRYVLLHFQNPDSHRVGYLVLHDEHSRPPMFEKIQSDLHPHDCFVKNIAHFQKDICTSKELQATEFFCLLILSPNPTHEFLEGCDFLDQMDGYFETIEQIIIPNISNPLDGLTAVNDIEAIKEEIRYLVCIDMTNAELTPSEEKIVKKLFKHVHTIQYKKLGGGFSGSKVFEITPIKYANPTTKYVVKLNDLSNIKLKNEADNFNEHIKDVDRDYGIEIVVTERYRAVKYNYASDDGEKPSIPLATYLKSSFDKGEVTFDTILICINKLFSIKLFDVWKSIPQLVEIHMAEEYRSYVKFPAILEKIARMLNLSIDDAKKLPLVQNYYRIADIKIKSYKKICHGDLHTENIFVDHDNDIYLIDFGDTGKHHSLIDHATLEASIKFRHVPRYMPTEELILVEKELLSDSTFLTSYEIKSSVRADIKDFYKIVQRIRFLSKDYMLYKDIQLEYFLSLFMITLRQINYPDLNQLYALRSAEVLAEEIVKRMQ